jgi:hypothetical protein
MVNRRNPEKTSGKRQNNMKKQRTLSHTQAGLLAVLAFATIMALAGLIEMMGGAM